MIELVTTQKRWRFSFFSYSFYKMNTNLNSVPDGLSETHLYNAPFHAVDDCALCESIPQLSWTLGSCARCRAQGVAQYENRYFAGRALGDFQMDDDTVLGSTHVYHPCKRKTNGVLRPYGSYWQYYNNPC